MWAQGFGWEFRVLGLGSYVGVLRNTNISYERLEGVQRTLPAHSYLAKIYGLHRAS